MYSIQVNKTIEQFISIFFLIGIWQIDEESKSRKIAKKAFYTFFGALLPTFFAINAFLCGDRDESFFSVQIAIHSAVTYVKLLYILFKKPEILAFLNDQIVLHSIETRDEYERVSEKIKKLTKFANWHCLSIFVTAAMLIILKLPMISTDKGLPFFISFSWNDSQIIYWLAYLLMSLLTMLYWVINLMTALVWYIMLHYSIEYEVLGNKFKSLGMTTENSQDKDKKQPRKVKNRGRNQRRINSIPLSVKFVENLVVLVKAHRNLTETIDRFRSCFSTLFLIQITTSGIVICSSVYSLAFASKENVFQTEMYVICLLHGLFDIFLVMYLANEISSASDRLSYCLFESNWIEQAESCKKYVLIMGEVLKQPQQLVILIYPMNLETFVRIVKGAYSMFNILKSFQ